MAGLSIEQLIAKKKDFETEIQFNCNILSKNGVGMSEDLIDSEGFPRADLDVGLIRNARVKIIYLRNDLKNLMEEIEGKLHEIHQNYRSNKDLMEEKLSTLKLHPFLVVNRVDEGSPAEVAGLKLNDLITQFGSITKTNFTGLQAIGALVENSEQKEIVVCIERNNTPIKLSLKPAVWSGKGLLGCNVLPVK
ncbi:26S proteasome non-ATPase regulatory subunit 9 isoform X3 [Hydra vulgaris]|uniref:26S proteasome non-ATPase regulatory subunit 9 n=1 Tax=Hydra vulgaris TaxID=6087 RepID=A0ABM4CZC3_HYDVU